MSDGTSCVGYTGGYGLHTYCVNVTTPDGRVVAPVACVTTEPGRKLKIEDTTTITRGASQHNNIDINKHLNLHLPAAHLPTFT